MRQRIRSFASSLVIALVVSVMPVGAMATSYWQCVPFARLISGIQIFGDARTWWSQAVGKYETGAQPKAGAVLCFKPTGRMRLGHVAVVSEVLTDRVIQVTHANWSMINGGRGQVEENVTVIDVSPKGDWSQVKVWYDPLKDLGTTSYPTHGFIYQNAQAMALAAAAAGFTRASDAAVAMTQNAVGQVTQALKPGASPLALLSQAADSTDRIAGLIEAMTGQNTAGN
jgi:surface antigen